ncbi:unnamed protein product [Trichogramma brassicae]|uniref:INTS8 TPR repeats domain-containing protein n=1 Tax=Trichogramma brassicae TaxID=86971 RepID=A0A6H5ID54_9HYME|nr:unnamed protein product [Trichogramma brassicae]
MDVDLLRPGTVPISPDTLLWFEFLLNPSLLKTHITKASPDPSPTELMIKFMSIDAEQKSEAKPADNNDTNDDHTLMPSSKWTCKQLALKILSLKIAAYLKWDWEYLQKKIPLVQQINLIQDLYYITLNLTVQVPNIPEIPLNNITDTAKPQRVLFSLESQLISSYDPQEIRDLIVEIGRHKRGPNVEPMWRINNHWEIPIPLQSVICSLSDGFLKDYAYILLAKSRELAGVKDFSGSINLINIIENEIQKYFKSLNDNRHYLGQGASQASKLLKLLNWEKLLIDIYHCLYYWPAKGICDTQSLTIQCKQCLESRQATDHVIPRMEIIENCTVFLLNMSEWDYLIGLEKQWSCFELASALSTIAKFKGQKFPKEAWDIILASISTKPSRDQAQKRNSSNSGANSSSRDPMTNVPFTLLRLREATVLNVTISLLARMHNILRDESSLDLYAPFITYWPASIPNAKQYNTRTVGEHLFQLVTQGLRYYPHNVPWLRLLGDLNFVVLCQFLEEVDYTLAFKLAGTEQKTSVPNDAMDAYYECIWDTTILEYLINLHSKRGEHHRKQLAIKVIGLLELNSNNNDEIQKEAANIRKTKFLRALSKQYLFQT